MRSQTKQCPHHSRPNELQSIIARKFSESSEEGEENEGEGVILYRHERRCALTALLSSPGSPPNEPLPALTSSPVFFPLRAVGMQLSAGLPMYKVSSSDGVEIGASNKGEFGDPACSSLILSVIPSSHSIVPVNSRACVRRVLAIG